MGTLTLCPSYELSQRFGLRHEIVVAPGTVETAQNSSTIDKSNEKNRHQPLPARTPMHV